jgi:hypothetical protein
MLEPSNLGNGKGQGSVIRLSVLTWQKAFLEVAPGLWPNVFEICKKVHVSRELYYRALRQHPAFARAINEIDRALTDAVVAKNANMALLDKGVIDRMAYLRAKVPELFDRAKVIRVEGVKLSAGEADGRAKLAQEAIDGEIIGEYRKRKAKRRAQIGGGGQGQAKGGGA